jgi:hypothetical protein
MHPLLSQVDACARNKRCPSPASIKPKAVAPIWKSARTQRIGCNHPGTSIRAKDVGPRPKFVTISQRAHNTGRPPVTATRAPEI